MGDKNSATIEDYLETLYILQRDGVPIVGVRLAEMLGVDSSDSDEYLKTDDPGWPDQVK